MATRASLRFDNTTESHFWEALADEISRDEKIDSWPLMGSDWPMIALFLFYLHFSTKLGPKLMKDRPTPNIKWIMAAYNVLQIYLNGALFFYCFWKPGFASFVVEASCEKPHVFPRTADEANQLHQFHRGAWYYLITKMLDLLDTVFMVAHKKTPGFLHLYHHSTMLLVVFFGFKYVRPIHTVFPSITNNLAHVSRDNMPEHFRFGSSRERFQFGSSELQESGEFGRSGLEVLLGRSGLGVLRYIISTHVFMYTYYLICLFNPGFGQRYKGIKMAITGFQIAQFIGIILHCVAYNYLCPVQKIIVCVLFFQNSMFLVLFSNFFIKSYLTNDKKTKLEIAAPKKKVS